MVNTLACSKFIKWTPPAAVKAKKAIGKKYLIMNKKIVTNSTFK